MKKSVILIMTVVLAVFSLLCGCNNTNEIVNEQPAQETTQTKEETSVVQPKTKYDYFCDYMKANGTVMVLGGENWYVINLTTDSDSPTCLLGLCPDNKHVLLYSKSNNSSGGTALYEFVFGNYSRTAYNGSFKIELTSSMYAEYSYKLSYNASSHSFTYCYAFWSEGTISSSTLDADAIATFCQVAMNLVYSKARVCFILEPTLGVDFDLFV